MKHYLCGHCAAEFATGKEVNAHLRAKHTQSQWSTEFQKWRAKGYDLAYCAVKADQKVSKVK